MGQIIPIDSTVGASRFQTVLDGTRYLFEFRFNARGQYWVFDIYTEQNEAIVCGVKVLLGVNLIGLYQDTRLPSGVLFAVDLDGNGSPIEMNDLGGRVVLTYTPEAELEVILS